MACTALFTPWFACSLVYVPCVTWIGVCTEIKSDIPEAVKELFATVFKGGCKSAQDYKEECPSIKDIIQWDWFKQDLPDKADQMTKIYNEKTAIRRASPELQKLLVGDGPAKGGKHEDGDDPGGVLRQ